MKKYIAPIIIFLFIIGTLTAFFVYEKSIASGFPSFYIQKTAGDKNEMKNVVLHGTYSDSNFSDNLEISKQGTDYYRNRSYLKRLDGISDPLINHWQKEYRGFMRSKREERNHYYEDKGKLIYADIDLRNYSGHRMSADMKMKIDVLDKKTKQKSSFEVAIPDIQKYSWMYIERLYYDQNKLFVITSNEDTDIPPTEEHIYQIDLKTQKVEDDQQIRLESISGAAGGKQADESYLIERSVVRQNGGNEHTIVFNKATYKIHGEQDELVDSQFVAYNLKNKTMKELKLPRELRKGADAVLQNGSFVLFTKESKKSITVYSYDLKTEKVLHQQTFPMEGGKEGTPIKLRNNKIYIVGKLVDAKKDADILVADVKTGKTLFKGVVKAKGGKRLSGDQSLHLEDINIENGEVK